MYTPIKITLKNNKVITIREAKIADAKMLTKVVKEYVSESDYIPITDNELKLMFKSQEKWINSFLQSTNSILLVAEYNNTIVGNIDLTGADRKMMQHTATIGMGIIKEWQNVGLGTAFIEEVIDWAQSNKQLELIWLTVFTSNKQGISLYKKMGFVENGIVPMFFKKENIYFDKLTMSLNTI